MARKKQVPSRFPPLSVFAQDFGGGYILCFSTASSEEMMFCGGQPPRRVSDFDTVGPPKSFQLTPIEEAEILRRFAALASDYDVTNARSINRQHIIFSFATERVYVATCSPHPTVIDFCLAYRDLSSLIASRVGASLAPDVVG